VPLDVTDDPSWASAAAATVTELGGFDLLVNNAGVEISSLIVDLDPKDVRLMLDVNVLGTSLGVKHAVMESGALLPPGERGEIVIRSSLMMAGYY
jgi:3alpha(or 20beta)-hydroxysteroid dehydrogenase